MLVCCDVNGVIDAYPSEMRDILQSLRAAGHTVHILTGTDNPTATDQDCADKASYLEALGCGECWDAIAVVPRPHDENKAAYLTQVGASLMIDNTKKVANTCANVCPVLVPWQTRE